MEVFFLGTGGGRINLIKQVRGTGGFRINSSSASIHVDPGPGALVRSVKHRQSPLGLDGVIVSHNHIDHCTDAMALIEGMSHYGLKKKGVLIGSRQYILGEGGTRGISDYHLSKVETAYAAVWGEKKEFRTAKGSFVLEVVQMKHEEPTAFGFVISLDGKKIGHITDTEYLGEFGQAFSGCDALIVNCMKPEPDKYGGHLCTADVIRIVSAAKPKSCVITHMGMKMQRSGPANEAAKIEKATGVRTVAARDGLAFKV